MGEAHEWSLSEGLVAVNWRWGAGNISHSLRLYSGNERNRSEVVKRWAVSGSIHLSEQQVSVGCVKAQGQCETLQWGVNHGLYDDEIKVSLPQRSLPSAIVYSSSPFHHCLYDLIILLL